MHDTILISFGVRIDNLPAKLRGEFDAACSELKGLQNLVADCDDHHFRDVIGSLQHLALTLRRCRACTPTSDATWPSDKVDPFDQCTLPAGIKEVGGFVWEGPADSAPELGSCCACGNRPAIGLLSINRQVPDDAHAGWGCFQCGADRGAVVVLCRKCLSDGTVVRFACNGRPGDGRIPIEQLVDAPLVEHNLSHHPEVRP